MNGYALGNLVRIGVTFANSVGTAVDPAVVKCQVYTPAGVTTTYTYGTDAAVVKSTTGIYYLDVDADEIGEWHFRWYATELEQAAAAEESGFIIEPSVFA